MTITRKPKKAPAAKVEQLIQKGGSVAGEKGSVKPHKLLQLRLERLVVGRIDALLESRTVPPSRHTWFLEAIHEKLEREEEVPVERGLVKKKMGTRG